MNSRPSSTRPPHHSQRGFSLVVVFAAVVGLMAVVTLYVIAPVSRDGVGTGAVAAAQASGIIQQGALLEGAFVTKLQQGMMPYSVSYTSTAPFGMLVNPNTTFASGLIPRPVPSPDAFVSTGGLDGQWIFRGARVRFPNVGIDANYDYSFMTTNLKQDVCKQINLQLHGDTTIPVVGTINELRTAAPIDLAKNTNLSGYTDFSGWANGCLQSSDGVYVYFHIVLPQ